MSPLRVRTAVASEPASRAPSPSSFGASRRAREARKLAALGELAPGIAHEINTPTQYIGDNLRFLLDAFRQLAALLPADAAAHADGSPELAYLREEIPSAIGQSLDGVAQVSHVVDAMKRFATAPVAGGATVDPNQAVQRVVSLARNEWKYVSEVVCDLDPTLPGVPCPEAELNQLVLGLLLGAAHAVASRGAGGRITVATRGADGWVELTVSDPGAELPADVGEPAATSPRVRGLALARDLAVEHGGAIEVVSATGQGTTIVVRLPVARGAGPEEGA